MADVMTDLSLAIQWGKRGSPLDPKLDFCLSRGEAWLDLIVMARSEPCTVLNKGRRVDLGVGQLVAPVSMLTGRWNWTTQAVRQHLSRLSSVGLITTEVVGGRNTSTVVTIVNYETYSPAVPFLKSVAGVSGNDVSFDSSHEQAAAWLLHYIQAHAKLAMACPNWRRALAPGTREAILSKTNGRCVYCSIIVTNDTGQPTSYEPDHVLPVAKGGSDDIANLVPSCHACNSKKRAKTALVFLGGDT